MEFKHTPVLLRETVDALCVKENGLYVDCTAGGGGHSFEILKRLGNGLLIDIDRDPDAVLNLTERFKDAKNVRIVHDNFFNIKNILSSFTSSGADGILADLGVSSFQIDNAERGFSFHTDAPLDMRMSKEGLSAADLVNTLPQSELQRIIYAYGEEKFAPSISRNIVKEREKEPITTTLRLAEIISASVPAYARRDGHPARKTFQALRIEVNGELRSLDKAVCDMFDLLKPGGRLAVITFHSLEDRTVKKCFADFCSGCTCPPDFPVCVCGKKPRGKLPFKVITAGEEELNENPRCRSAKLRAIEKL
ncbi:MAG: 16S rRNA (cytosine(1402)-N(4))-methyltransferase RsmH [Clostridiales bacterium]|nr:16S rRNA (cytosine(1402)-N(4))-methyltransferase RsmH [Clostridiales bacterium]